MTLECFHFYSFEYSFLAKNTSNHRQDSLKKIKGEKVLPPVCLHPLDKHTRRKGRRHFRLRTGMQFVPRGLEEALHFKWAFFSSQFLSLSPFPHSQLSTSLMINRYTRQLLILSLGMLLITKSNLCKKASC